MYRNSEGWRRRLLAALMVLACLTILVPGDPASAVGEKPGAPRKAASPTIAAPTPNPVCGPLQVTDTPSGSSNNWPWQINATDVAAIAANDVWVVGYMVESIVVPPSAPLNLVARAVIMHWDGQRWDYHRYLWDNTQDISFILSAVTAVSATDIWAIGYIDAATLQPVTAHYDGSRWMFEMLPDSITSISDFDILAFPGGEVWALVSRTPAQAILEHRSGGVWQQVVTAAAGPGISRLTAFAGVTTDDIWAVGSQYIDSSSAPLIEHWDGQTWERTVFPEFTYNEWLSSVAVLSADNVLVVGSQDAPNDPSVIWHWDGTSWANVPDYQSDQPGGLTDVAFHGQQDVWALASVDRVSRFSHWDGLSWTDTPGSGKYLLSMSVVPAALWAVSNHTIETQPLVPFTDISGNTFEGYIDSLACADKVDGYADNTFRPYQDATRADIARWLVKLRGWNLTSPVQPTFSDVPVSSADYGYIETAFAHGVMSGYSVAGGREFRPDNKATRGQASKMVVNAFGWSPDSSGGPHFNDVDPANPFYSQIETIFQHGLISGYADGAFRWGNNLTRGQLSKILYLAGQN